MKLVGRKTKKAIEKSVRKAMKKHGPAIVAALAGSITSAIATLASTGAPSKPGKSNLSEITDRATRAMSGKHPKKARKRRADRDMQVEGDDMEGTRAARPDAPHH